MNTRLLRNQRISEKIQPPWDWQDFRFHWVLMTYFSSALGKLKTGFILTDRHGGKRKKFLDVPPCLVSLTQNSLVGRQGWPGAGYQQLLVAEGAWRVCKDLQEHHLSLWALTSTFLRILWTPLWSNKEKNDPLHIIGGKTEVNRSYEVHLDAHGKLLVAPKVGGGFQTTDLVQCQHSSLPGQWYFLKRNEWIDEINLNRVFIYYVFLSTRWAKALLTEGWCPPSSNSPAWSLRSAEFPASPQIYQTRICIFTRPKVTQEALS